MTASRINSLPAGGDVPFQFTVSPDFSPRLAPGWYVFNTWLQRVIGEAMHLELYPSFEAQRQAIGEDKVDLIYANPFDASLILRQHGFRALAAPAERPDEALIVARRDHPAATVKDLGPGQRLTQTADPDVNTICAILLEPADIVAADLPTRTVDSYVLVARDLLEGRADIGFFLEEAFGQLSRLATDDLRPIGRSQIHVVRHVVLAGPRLEPFASRLTSALVGMHEDERDRSVSEGIGVRRFEALDEEEIEFMIDLVDTLIARPA